MKVKFSENKIDLENEDIKWYLLDGSLWITKCKDYYEIEKMLSKSIGSYNFLTDSNDTILFDKCRGCLITALITGISQKLELEDVNNIVSLYDYKVLTGNLELIDKELSDKEFVIFEFSNPVIYSSREDCLYSISPNSNKINAFLIRLTSDFSVVITDNEVTGWVLNNPRNHIYIDDEMATINQELLVDYIKANKMLEKDDLSGLKRVINILDHSDDSYNRFKEALIDIVEYLE